MYPIPELKKKLPCKATTESRWIYCYASGCQSARNLRCPSHERAMRKSNQWDEFVNKMMHYPNRLNVKSNAVASEYLIGERKTHKYQGKKGE